MRTPCRIFRNHVYRLPKSVYIAGIMISGFKIIQTAIDGHPDQIPLDWASGIVAPRGDALFSIEPASPSLARSMECGKALQRANSRPFGFMLSYSARTGIFAEFPETSVVDLPGRGRPRKGRELKPIAPFCRDPNRALGTVFDRISGESVDAERLKT